MKPYPKTETRWNWNVERWMMISSQPCGTVVFIKVAFNLVEMKWWGCCLLAVSSRYLILIFDKKSTGRLIESSNQIPQLGDVNIQPFHTSWLVTQTRCFNFDSIDFFSESSFSLEMLRTVKRFTVEISGWITCTIH